METPALASSSPLALVHSFFLLPVFLRLPLDGDVVVVDRRPVELLRLHESFLSVFSFRQPPSRSFPSLDYRQDWARTRSTTV